MGNLEPLSPEEAVDMYLQSREPEVSKKTLQNQRYRLNRWIEWCDSEEIESMSEITGRIIHQFRVWRSRQVKRITLVNELRTLQTFLEFCAKIDAVEPGMRERVLIPNLQPGDESKDIQLEADRAVEILDHLARFEYASRAHVVFALLWHTGIRLGTLRSIDIDDCDLDAGVIDLRHRAESDTPLKNGVAAERSINVSAHYCQVIADYIDHNRPDTVDEYGREPLISSNQGRLTAVPIRRLAYKITQPCYVGGCPHDKDPTTCEWRLRDHLRDCPSARSPHAIRRGSITHHLRQAAPPQVVQERCNVSAEVLDTHYDERTEREKAAVRRQWLRDALGDDMV